MYFYGTSGFLQHEFAALEWLKGSWTDSFTAWINSLSLRSPAAGSQFSSKEKR